MGRGSSKLSGGSGGGSSTSTDGGNLFQTLDLAYDANGNVSAERLDTAATQINSMVDMGDSVIGSNGLRYIPYIKMGADRYVDAGSGDVYTSRELANTIAYFGNNGENFSIKKMNTVTFLDSFGNRQHAITLDKKPTNFSGRSTGTINGYKFYKIGNSSLTRSNYDYFAVKS